MIVGREPFIYVADTENNRVVMMDIAGRILGAREIRRPIALAQDYQLNLIVCGELVDAQGTVFSAVFKLNLVDVSHNIGIAKIDTLLPKTSFDYLKPQRKYTGVCVFSNNSFLVSRTGPANSNLIDPDNLYWFLVKK
jgi:sugar lactone lactonase YvrE